MRRVAILTPSYDGTVVCDFCVTMASIFQHAAKNRPDLDINLNFWMNDALVQRSRNNLFSAAYFDGFDDVVFIDCDQSFPYMAFFEILDHPVDVVGVPVRMKTDDERYNLRPENPMEHEWDSKLKLLKTEVLGTGFIRYSRKAMEAIWERSEVYHDESEKRMVCNTQIINGGLISEDVQICEKLKDAGIPVYVDINYTCDHFGTKRYTGDYKKHFASTLYNNVIGSAVEK